MAYPKIVLLKKNPKEDRYPLALRINVKRKQFQRRLKGVWVPESHWDPVSQVVLAGLNDQQGKPYSKFCNMQIAKALGKANEILRRYHLMDSVELTHTRFANEYDNEAMKGDFLSYWKESMQSAYDRRKIGTPTKVQHERTLRKLEICFKEVFFSDISREWLEKFDAWHAKEQAKAGNDGRRERIKALYQLHGYLNKARADGKKFNDPFQGFDWPKYRNLPVFLTHKEFKKLLTYYRNPQAIEEALEREAEDQGLTWHHKAQKLEAGVNRVRRTLRAFIVQCITGMRDSDLARLTHEDNIEDDQLVFIPHKTRDTSGIEVRIPFFPLLEEMIVSEKGPLFDTVSNQKYNQRLKEVARVCGIDKVITTHVGRHTFATMYLERGGRVEVLRELMGLTNFNTLMVYVHVTDQRRKKEYLKVMGKLG